MEPQITRLLELLTDREVEFIIIGGVAALIHGAPLPTFDLDIIANPEPGNLDRLHGVLCDIDATFREPGQRRLPPGRHHLPPGGAVLLRTSLGPLDILASLPGLDDYDAIERDTVPVTYMGRTLRVLSLPRLIAVKTEVGRPKDQLAVPILMALLPEE